MGLKKNNPGCKCCGGCLLHEETFDGPDSSDLGPSWEEVAQNWQRLNNALRVTAASAILRSAKNHPDNRNDYLIDVRIRAASTSDRARIIVDYRNVNNYLFAEIRFGSSGRISIHRRINGVESQEAASATINLPINTFHRFTVCITHAVSTGPITVISYTTGTILRDTSVATAAVTGTQPGVYGLGTGSMGSALDFEDFKATKVSPDCESCLAPCANCIFGTAPGLMQLVVQGVTTRPGFTNNCERENGTYILPSAGTSFGGRCDWSLTTSWGNILFQVGPTVDGTKAILYAQTFLTGTSANAFWQLNTDLLLPINCQFDGIVLPFSSTAINNCIFTGSTITVTAL